MEETKEQVEQYKNCGDCESYFKVHFSTSGLDDQLPHDESQVMCIATPSPIFLNRFTGLMGLMKGQSPFIKSCTHFKEKGEIAIARKVIDWFCNREDQVKKQSYESMLLELSNFMIEDEKFDSVDQVLNWMQGKEIKVEENESTV